MQLSGRLESLPDSFLPVRPESGRSGAAYFCFFSESPIPQEEGIQERIPIFGRIHLLSAYQRAIPPARRRIIPISILKSFAVLFWRVLFTPLYFVSAMIFTRVRDLFKRKKHY
jgi:hypothetical protein